MYGYRIKGVQTMGLAGKALQGQDRTGDQASKQGAISAKPVRAAPTLPRLLCIIIIVLFIPYLDLET